MKTQITQKAVKANYDKIILIPSMSTQYLLSYSSPIAYTAGVYGWNTDIYDINGVAVVMGYRPFGTIKADHDLCRKYDDAAQKIRHNYNLTYNEQRAELENLLDKFIAEVTA